MPRTPDGRERKMKNYHYLDRRNYVYRISALRIPGPTTSPQGKGIWHAQYMQGCGYCEVEWEELKTFTYLGCTKQ